MALGKPAVPLVKAPEVRSIEQALAAVRERLRLLDAAVNSLSTGSSSSLSNTVAALQANIQALNRRVTQLELQIGVTDVVVLTAAEAISIGDAIVMVGESTCGVVNPADPTRVHACIGLAQGAAASGQSVNVQRRGSFTIPVGTLEPGRAVYAQLGGGLTQVPGYSAYAVPVGIATSATTLWVQPADPALLNPDTYTSEFDLPVPVSYALLLNQLGAIASLVDLLNQGENGYVIVYQGMFGIDPNGGGGGGGGVSDGTYGQITVTGGGAVWTINANAVTLAQMATLPAGTIIGNDSGVSATPQALTAAEAKALLAIDSGDITDFYDGVLSTLFYALQAGNNIAITPSSAGVLVISSTGPKWTNSSSAPGSPSDGDEWFDPDTGILYRYVNDGNSSQWVEL